MHTLNSSLLLGPILVCLSWIYGILIKVRTLLWKLGFYKTNQLQGTVISIGNIEVGGTGKSPIAISLCLYLQAKGYKPAILTRGYGVSLNRSDYMILVDGKCIATSRPELSLPDEARMQSLLLPKVPIVVGPRRWVAYQKFMDLKNMMQVEDEFKDVTHWVLDDGFQHWGIARQWDIVLISGQDVLKNRLLPWGPLREPLKALNRAHAVLLTRVDHQGICERKNELKKYLNQKRKTPILAVNIQPQPIALSVDWRRYGILEDDKEELRPSPFVNSEHLPAFLVSGIAKPRSFVSDFVKIYGSIRSDLPSVVCGSFAVGDHRRFHLDDLVKEIKKTKLCSVVTTAKDVARDPRTFFFLGKILNKKIFIMDIDVLDSHEMWKVLGIAENA